MRVSKDRKGFNNAVQGVGADNLAKAGAVGLVIWGVVIAIAGICYGIYLLYKYLEKPKRKKVPKEPVDIVFVQEM